MSTTEAKNSQVTKELPSVPKLAVGILLGILVFGVFVVGYDQGQIFSVFQGQQAYGDMWMHEFTHDMRHSAGFMCH